MTDTIVELVKNDPQLRGEIQSLLDGRYLLPGIFHPEVYLVDNDRTDMAWRNRHEESDRLAMLAVGMAIRNQFFAEVFRSIVDGDEPHASAETLECLKQWEKFVLDHFVDGESLINSSELLGQYLDFTNRKSQGF